MKKKGFNKGMSKLMDMGYSKQSAFNKMKGLAKKNRIQNKPFETRIHFSLNYLGAIIVELILLFYKIPSKEGIQISLIKTILPLSPATQPLIPFITIIAILLQIYPLFVILIIVKKLIK